MDPPQTRGSWRRMGACFPHCAGTGTAGDLDAYLAIAAPGRRYADARVELTSVDRALFRVLRQACRLETGVDVTYGSLSSGTVVRRRIYPHTLVRVGRRLHARAWCPMEKAHRDFVLSRMTDAALSSASRPKEARNDKAWRPWSGHVGAPSAAVRRREPHHRCRDG